MTRKLFASIFLIFALSDSTAYSQDSWMLQSFGGLELQPGAYESKPLSGETELLLARVGRPITVTVGESELSETQYLERLVDQVCGKTRPDEPKAASTQESLYAKAKALNDGAAVPVDLINDEVHYSVRIPFCLKFETAAPVQVRKNNTFSGLIATNSHGAPEHHFQGVYELNREFIDSRITETMTSGGPIPEACSELTLHSNVLSCAVLRPGDVIILPELAPVRSFHLAEHVNSAELTVLFQDREPRLWAQLRSGTRAAFNLEYVGTAHPGDNCVDENGSTLQNGRLYDSNILEEVYLRELSLRGDTPELIPSNRGSIGLSTTIGIIDSGVVGADPVSASVLIPDKFLLRNWLHEDDRTGLDCNDLVQQIRCFFYGQSSGENFITSPHKGAKQRLHGTRVAELALGGGAMREKWLAWDNSPIQLHIFNLADSESGEANFIKNSLNVFIDAVEYFERNGVDPNGHETNQSKASIINISHSSEIRSPTFFGSFHHLLLKKPNLLFVVAAGNDSRDLREIPIFPAIFGGPQNGNVITVGSHNEQYELTQFSNRGSEYVDIVAPGCAVARKSPDDDNRTLSGTSYSAPLVSFAAALIATLRFEESLDPIAIKRRLLSSAKLPHEHHNLSLRADGYVSNGAVLDIVRAVSIRSDVLRYEENGAEIYRFGTLGNSNTLHDQLEAMCGSNRNNVQVFRYFLSRSDEGEPYSVGRVQQRRAWQSLNPEVFVSTTPCDWEPDGKKLKFEYLSNGTTESIDLLSLDAFDITLREDCSKSPLCRT